MTIDKKKLGIQILSLVGIIITIKLACIYYVANFQKYALSSFCSINDFIEKVHKFILFFEKDI